MAALAIAGACRPDAVPRRGSAAASGRLVGVWDATFVLTTPPLGVDTTVWRRSGVAGVRGVVAFVPNHWLTAPSGQDDGRRTPPSVHGSYDVEFSPFGFEPREPDQVPAAVATSAAHQERNTAGGEDSVTLVLGPGGERARVVLEGAWRADSITGTWRLESAQRGSATATGRFVMAPRRPASRRDGPSPP